MMKFNLYAHNEFKASNSLLFILMALFMLMTSCSSETESAKDVDNIIQKLMSNKWIGRNASFGVGDNDHAWVDVESTTFYFITENSGIHYWIQKDYDTDLGNTITRDYSAFTYSVYGENIRIEGLDTPLNLTFHDSWLEDGDLFFEASPMNSADYELIKSLEPVTGKCGDNLTYLYDKKYNAIQISGSGDMYDYTAKNQPWHDLYIKGVVIDEDVTSIGDNAFNGQYATAVDWLGSTKVERIGRNAFKGCMLTNIIIPNTVREIKDEAFSNCRYLTDVNFQYGSVLESIGSYVFENCSKLKLGSMQFGEKIKNISSNAFFSNVLGKIEFSEGIQTIGTGAFLGGITNTSLVLPNSLQSVGATIFKGGFSKIVIGTNLKEIGKCAFISSASSGSVYINQGMPPTVTDCIIANATDWDNNENRWTLYVPKGCKKAYSSHSIWNKFKAIYEDETLEGEGTGDNDENNPTEDVTNPTMQDEIDAKDYRRGIVSTSFCGAGTAASPYLISSAADLRLMSNECRNGNTFKGKYFKMTNDIVINRNVLNANGEPNDDRNFERWIPIGRGGSYRNYGFYGSFDGDNHIISGLYINRPNIADHIGLFGIAVNTTIKNIIIKDSYIKGSGAFILGSGVKDGSSGYAGTVINCHNYGTIEGINVAGVVGNANYVKQCSNYGSITGINSSGGICGTANDLVDCANYGNVSSGESHAGGVVRLLYSSVKNCVNYGTVTSSFKSGGICGRASSATIKNCVNIGTVDGENISGAICASIKSSTIRNNFYLNSKQSIAVGEKLGTCSITKNNACSEYEMCSEEVLQQLNSNREKDQCKWYFGNDGYPTLEWIK